MTTITTFANAMETQRCIRSLDRIADVLLPTWRDELAEIGCRHPDIACVTDSLIGSLDDARGDSGLKKLRE
ncbi:MAG: hypothetical protein CMO26_19985 [Thiotrichales bacterium]|nr:hypothetical protein [Thiotrichales bacterium]